MKFTRYLAKFAWILPALMLGACSDDNEPFAVDPDGTGEGDAPSELTLTLNMPAEEVIDMGRAATDEAFKSVFVVCYDRNNNFLSKGSATSLTVSGNRATVTVPLHKKTVNVEFVANVDVSESDLQANRLSAITSTQRTPIVMHGAAKLSDLIAPRSTLSLTPMVAKVSVTVKLDAEFSGKFTLSDWEVRNSYGSGFIAANASYPTGSAFATTATKSGTEAYIFESPAESDDSPKMRVVIKGKYNGGKDTWYTAAFRIRSGSGNYDEPGNYSYTPIAVQRNHHYQFTITAVRGEGYASAAEALAAKPDNRLTVGLVDETLSITDIIADQDRMLGIGDQVEVGASTTSVEVPVLSNCGQPSFDLSNANGVVTGAVLKSQQDVSSGKLYTYTLSLTANPTAGDRFAELTVRCGNLSRTLKVLQTARDFLRDPNRPVAMTMVNGSSTILSLSGSDYNSSYFYWVDNVCKGLRYEDNRDVSRDGGLHFPAVPAYTVTYTIPKLSGDKSATVTGAPFQVSEQNGKYVVTMTATTKGISIGTLTIVNASGVDIRYSLYRTGYMHELTSAMAASYMRPAQTITGWFYYEVVNCNGKYILDRNLGASNNLPYISTNASLRDNNLNDAAVGAYLMVAKETTSSTDYYADKPHTIISNLNVSKFNIPKMDDLEAMNIFVDSSNKVATASCSHSQVADGSIYFPHGGYYESDSPKFVTSANLWTRTLLAGNQGFDPNISPEFGYWYLYLNVYGPKVNFSPMRFANGSGGLAPDPDPTVGVYRYMPLRLIWEGN